MELWRALFSRTRRRVIALLFAHPGRSFYANEIVRRAGVGTGSVQRELARLADAGLLSVRRVGNQVHYRANPDSPFYAELRAMVMKSTGAAPALRRALAGAGGEVSAALVYGPGLESDGGPETELRLLVVSPDLTRAELERSLARTGFRIGLVLLRPERFRALRETPDPELARVLAGPHLVIAGSLDAP